MFSNTHVIFTGASGSGKTSACEYLKNNWGYYNYHPFSFVKRQYEDLYKLPIGYLDTVEGKNAKAPGMLCTFQEMFVEEYHFRKKTDPLYTTRNIKRELTIPLVAGTPLAIQALRNVEEVDELLQILGKFLVIDIVGRGKLETSDSYLSAIRTRLSFSDKCLGVSSLSNVDISLEDFFQCIVDKINWFSFQEGEVSQ